MKSFSSLFRWAVCCTFIWYTLSGCSANWHLRKAISKDPSVILQPQRIELIDTTIITAPIRVDGVFATNLTDTILIEKERLRVEIRRVHDTIQVSAECASDTVRIVKEVELPPQINYIPRKWWERVSLPVLLLLVFGYIAKKLFDRWANRL